MTPTPLHTRLISLRLSWAEEERVLAQGRLVDVRKRGIVPLAGTIQGPGIIHDMAVRVWLGFDDLKICRIEPVMSAYPFAPSSQTRGEGCPDRLGDVQRLLGLRLPEGYGDAVMERIGGPRGCFHVLTLLRLLGPSVVWAMERERRHRSRSGARRPAPGSPIFARSILVDGLKHDGMDIDLHGSLSDVHYPPGAETLPLQEELESGFEAMITLRVELPAMAAHGAQGRSRQSGPGVENVGPWESIDSLGGLHGLVLRKGFSAQVQELFGDGEGIQPITHLVFMLAPVVMQCMPSLLDELELRPRRAEGPHAATNSCHMWRAGGPLQSM
jgi:hypothetical protein